MLPTRAATNPHDCSFDEGDLCGWLVVNPGGTSSDERRPQDWQLADPTHTFAHVKDHTFEVENRKLFSFPGRTLGAFYLLPFPNHMQR